MTTETLDPETTEKASALAQLGIPAPQKPARTRRKDAGTHRPPKPAPAAPAGVLSVEQAAKLRRLLLDAADMRQELQEAQSRSRAADDTLELYLHALTAKESK